MRGGKSGVFKKCTWSKICTWSKEAYLNLLEIDLKKRQILCALKATGHVLVGVHMGKNQHDRHCDTGFVKK